MRLLVAAVLLCGVAFAEEDVSIEIEYTSGSPNGRFWKSCHSGEKLRYVIGFREGVSALGDLRLMANSIPHRVIHKEIIDVMDQIYSDPANARIPMYAAMLLVARKMRGNTDTEFQQNIAATRRRWTDIVEPKIFKPPPPAPE